MAAVEDTRSDERGGGVPPLDSARFVRLFVAPTASAIAAAGIAVAALRAHGTPHHVSVGDIAPEERPTDATVFAIGHGTAEIPTVSPAGVLEAVDTDDLPGIVDGLAATARFGGEASGGGNVGLPTAGSNADLPSSTLVRGPFSGDDTDHEPWRARDHEDDERTRRAAIALGCLEEHATDRAATAVSRFLDARPLPAGPFATDAGTFDVLDVLADRHAGLALAVCCGQASAHEVALTTWRREAAAVHRELDDILDDESADSEGPTRIEDAPLAPIARLARMARTGDGPVVITDGTGVVVSDAAEREGGRREQLAPAVRAVIGHGDGRVGGILVDDVEAVVDAIEGDEP